MKRKTKEQTKKIIFSILTMGIYTLYWLYKKYKLREFDKSFKIVLSLTSLFIILFVYSFITTPKGNATYSYDTFEQTNTYTTPAIPAKDAVYSDPATYKTEINGEYIIGKAPNTYVTGNEKEFTTSKSGNYIAGTDFPAGTYDLEALSGGGNVQGDGLNVIMGTHNDDLYTKNYDNHTFSDGDELTVSGVSIKLIPQNLDTFFIPPGTYNLIATKGGGNVQGSGLNEIMGVDNNDFYVKNYDNARLTEDSTLTISGVSLDINELKGKLVSPAIAATEEKTHTEIIDYNEFEKVCYIDDTLTDCSKLESIDINNLIGKKISTTTETLSIFGTDETCKSDSKTINCSNMKSYSKLKDSIIIK